MKTNKLQSIIFKNGKKLAIPIIQGGMGIGVSLANLSGNVSLNGALGVISAANPGYKKDKFEKDSINCNIEAIKEEIAKAKQISNNQLIGINIMCATNNYEDYVKASINANVDIIISGAGLPLQLPEYTKGSDVLKAPIISSGKALNVLLQYWDKHFNETADMIIIEGSKAGGHLGFKVNDLENDTCNTLDNILEDVLKIKSLYEQKYHQKIYVFVAGGIFDGQDIAHYIKKGANGVQMATRFIATKECDAHYNFKKSIIDAEKEDIMLVKSPTGYPGRAIKNKFSLSCYHQDNRMNCINCLKMCDKKNPVYCISDALIKAVSGDVDHGLVFCGSNAYKVKEIIPVKQLIDELVKESEENL